MSTDDCVVFLQWALPRLGMRWAGFRKPRGQVCKRVNRRIRELGLSGYAAYRRHLEVRPDEWRVLDSFCRVTISRFHRDRRVFELIRNRILPEIAAAEAGGEGDAATGSGEAMVRCWSAGCASGEEPYTLSIMWRSDLCDRFPDVRLVVVATDVHETVLERARAACYPASSVRELPEAWVAAAFEPSDGELCLGPAFRDDVRFVPQDIRWAMPDGPFHLIFCRNLVFTYFGHDLQSRLLSSMLERLLPGGYLILGAHEKLPPGEWPLARVAGSEPVYRLRRDRTP